MQMKTRWVAVDVDKLKIIFEVIDKVNLTAARGLLGPPEKDALINVLKAEIEYTIVKQEQPKETPKQETTETETKQAETSRKPRK